MNKLIAIVLLMSLNACAFTGVKKEHYPNGQLKSLTTFVKGKKIGQSKIWYPSGKLFMEVQYNGKENSEIDRYKRKDPNFSCIDVEFAPDGINLIRKEVCKKKKSKTIEYCESLEKMIQEDYFPPCFPDDYGVSGVLTLWYENGNKKYEGQFDHATPVGFQRGWYENGTLFKEVLLDDKGKLLSK